MTICAPLVTMAATATNGAATILPKALFAFRTAYPGINVNLRELATHDLLDSIRRREIDFGIGPAVEDPTEFHFESLFNEPIFALASRNFQLPKRRSVDLADLCALPLVMNSKSAELRKVLERALLARGLNMEIKFEVLHTHTLIALVMAGMGVGILPRIALPKFRGSKMQALPIANPALVRSVSIISLRGQSFSPAAKELTKAVTKNLRAQM